MGSDKLVSMLCVMIFHGSFGQQYGLQNEQAVGGVRLIPARPRRPFKPIPPGLPVDPSIQPGPVDVPIGGGLPAGDMQPNQPGRQPPPPTTTTMQATTITLHHVSPPQKPPTSPIASSSIPKTTTASYPRSCYPNPCKNKGVCLHNNFNQPQCTCRQLYLGHFCEVVISPPKNISIVQFTSESVQIKWKTPPRAVEIAGFVVQYNTFGEADIAFSQIIHPSVTQYTLRDLEPGTHYTVCISIVFKNVSNKKAVLRDQCREVQTKPLLLSEKGISVPAMGTIVGSLILLLIIIMIIALVCQRRCMKKKPIPLRPLGPVASARNILSSSRRARMLQPSRNANAATGDEYDTAKIHIPHTSQPLITPFKHSTNPFLSPPPLIANNANEPIYGNIFHDPHVMLMTHQPCVTSFAPPDVTETKQAMLSSDAFHYSRRLQQVSSVPPANVRALPVTISNHVMRTANARDMDASSEFDLHRTYFLPKY